MSENKKLNFHKRQFKAYLALRGITKADVARKIDMSTELFKHKSNRTYWNERQHHFSEDEVKKIIFTLHMSPQWQRRIFSKVLVK